MATTTPKRTLGEWAEEHHFKRSGQLRPATMASERCTVRQFVQWWGKDRPENIKPADLDDFLNGPDGLRVGPKGLELMHSGYNNKLHHMKAFVARLVTHGVVDAHCMDEIANARRTSHNGRVMVRLSHSQIEEAVTGETDPWKRWIVAFAYLTMGREGELITTRMSHFNLETGLVAWERPKVGDFDDGLPIFNQLREEYLRWKAVYLELCPGIDEVDGGSFVIPGRTSAGHKIRYHPDRHPTQVGPIIKLASARALGIDPSELDRQAAHIARRSGARCFYDQLVGAGVPDPIRIVMSMLGHTEQATTERYIGLRGDRERRNKVTIGSKLMDWTTDNVVAMPLRAASGANHG